MRCTICANDQELGQASQILKRLLSMLLGSSLTHQDFPRQPQSVGVKTRPPLLLGVGAVSLNPNAAQRHVE